MGPFTTARRRANRGRLIGAHIQDQANPARYLDLRGVDAGSPAWVVVTVEPTPVDAVDPGAGCADRSM